MADVKAILSHWYSQQINPRIRSTFRFKQYRMDDNTYVKALDIAILDGSGSSSSIMGATKKKDKKKVMDLDSDNLDEEDILKGFRSDEKIKSFMI